MPVTSSCIHCGGTFTHPPSVKRQFCSTDCRTAHRRAAGGWQTRTCKQCKHSFEIAGARIAEGGGRYCGDECRRVAKAIPERVCPACNTTFWSRHADTVYCSKTCGGVARRTRVSRQCLACGVTYEAEPSRLAVGKDLHCSRACAFPGPLDRTCERCGVGFTASRSEVAKGWGRFCSNECRRTRVERVCTTCGSLFEVLASKSLEGGKYCSVACRGLARRNRVRRECAICGEVFERPVSTAAASAALYCSRACNTQARRADPNEVERVRAMQRAHLASRAPTAPERILHTLLDDIRGPGGWARQHVVFDKWTVDAAVPELRLVIQADGSYWHGFDPATWDHPLVAKNRMNDVRQASYLAKAGWTLLRLWEHDLHDRPDWCRQQIVAVLGAASQPL